MYSLIVDYDTFSNQETVAVVVPATIVEVETTGYTAMIALSLTNLLLMCLMKRLGR